MIVSLNEIETTILKAARGAGMEWGLADEAGQAARFLARHGLPFEAPFVTLLSSRAWRTAPWLDGMVVRPLIRDAFLCPVRTGAYLCDLARTGPVIVERLISPLLLLPFAARRSAAVEVAWGGLRLRLDASKVTADPATPCQLVASEAEKVELIPLEGARSDHRPPDVQIGGASVEEAPWAKLQGYEAMTYVPASAKSRASGAGAGEIDND
jgi:hypothetical protein